MRKILKITSLLIVVLLCLFNINIKAEESNEVQKYEVTYILNGGEFESEPETTVEAGYILPVPTREGYVFHGWYLAEQKVVTVNASGTYVAKWLVLDCGDHKLINHEGKEAKCEEIGWQAYQTCEKCCYTTYVEIPELGHNYEGSACLNCGEKVSAGLKYEIIEGISINGKVIVPTTKYASHAALAEDFMKDLNASCGTNETLAISASTFHSKFGNHLSNTFEKGLFINDDIMWAKWSWLFEYISLKSNLAFDMTNKKASSNFSWSFQFYAFLTQGNRNGVNWANVDEYYNIPKKAVLSGMGTCTDKDVIIQKEYKGVVVSAILSGVFAGNTDITSVTIASGITSIQANEFVGCTGLEAINVDVKNETYKSVDGVLYSADGKTLLVYPAGKKAESYSVPEGVTSINNNAFKGCTSLKTLSLPSTVNNLINFGFENKIDLYYAKTVEYLLLRSTSIAYQYVNKLYLLDENNEYFHLTELVVPNDVTRIYNGFANYQGLTKVTFEEGSMCNRISNGAFSYCANLKEIELPNSIAYIDYDVFRGCTSLESITLPENLTNVYRSFMGCTNLKSVYMPLGLVNATILSNVFYNCPNLTIYCEAEAKPDTWADNWNGTCPVVWGYCIHKLEEHAAKAEDCENIGWDAYVTCLKCDYTTYKEIPATGHTYDEWTVVDAPECEATGLERRDCVNCDHFETQPIPATGHTMGEWYVVDAPECEAEGLEQKDCANCDHHETQPIPATGHTMGEWYVVDAPECEAEGLEQKDCANCDHHETQPIAPTGHTMGEWYVVDAPECEAEGLEQKDCANCDHHETQPIAATGHTMGEWYVVKEASTQVEGLKQKDCANCDHFETEAIRKVTFADLIERGMTAIGNIFDSIGNIFGSASNAAGSISDALNLDQVAKSFASFIQSIFAMDDEEEQKESLYEYIFG